MPSKKVDPVQRKPGSRPSPVKGGGRKSSMKKPFK
jgi:hypothetical protein